MYFDFFYLYEQLFTSSFFRFMNIKLAGTLLTLKPKFEPV